MENWIKLRELEAPHELTGNAEGDQGINVQVTLSPYDIPVAVRTSEEPGKRLFVIEFKYISGNDEPRETKVEDASVRILTGKKSGRLFRLEVAGAVGELTIAHQRKVDETLDRLYDEESTRSWRHAGNYHLAKEILDSNAFFGHAG